MDINKYLRFTLIGFVLMLSISISPKVAHGATEYVVVYATPYDFTEYDPYTPNSYSTAQWYSAVGAGLYRRNIDNGRSYSPDLADGMPTVSDNKLEYTVKLKSGLKFSDGTTLTADDVVFTYNSLSSLSTKSKSYGLNNYLASVSVIKLDDSTIKFTFQEPSAFNLGFLSTAIHHASNSQRLGNTIKPDSDDFSNTISAGPYKVESIDLTNMEITVVRNEYYWDAGNVISDKIIFKKIADKESAISALTNGDVQILDAHYAASKNEVSDLSGVKDETVAYPSHQELSFNHVSPWWGTGENLNVSDKTEGAKDVRKAISHIINRDYIVNNIIGGLAEPAATIVPSVAIGWDSSIVPREYSVDTAKQYMESAGFNYSTLGTPDAEGNYQNYFFNLTVLSPNTDPARNQWVTLIAQSLPKIGIGVTQVVSTGWSEIIPRTFGAGSPPGLYDDGGYDIFFIFYSWSLDFNPTGLYESTSLIPNGNNFYNFKNSAYDSLVKTYTQELDLEKRIDAFHDLQAFYYEWEIVAPIVYPQDHWVYADDLVGYDSVLLSTTQAQWDRIGSTAAVAAHTTSSLPSDTSSNNNSTNNSSVSSSTSGNLPLYLPTIVVTLLIIPVVKKEKIFVK